MKYLNTYHEQEEFLKDKRQIGFHAAHNNQFDIWTAELYTDNNSKYYLFLTADSDEQWAVIEFDEFE